MYVDPKELNELVQSLSQLGAEYVKSLVRAQDPERDRKIGALRAATDIVQEALYELQVLQRDMPFDEM